MSWRNLKWDDRSFIEREVRGQTSRLIAEMREQEVRTERRQEINALLSKAEDYHDRYLLEGNPRLLDLANDYAKRAATLADQWEKEALRENRRGGCFLWLLAMFLGAFFLPASLWLYPLFFFWWLKNYVIFRSRYWSESKIESPNAFSTKERVVNTSPTSSASSSRPVRYIKPKKGRLDASDASVVPLERLRFGEDFPPALIEKINQLDEAKTAWVGQAEILIEQVGQAGEADLKDFLEVQKNGQSLLFQLQDVIKELEGLPESTLNGVNLSTYTELAQNLEEALSALNQSRTVSPEQQVIESELLALEEAKQAWMGQLQEQAELAHGTDKVDVSVFQAAQKDGAVLLERYRQLLKKLDPQQSERKIDIANLSTSIDEVESLIGSVQEVMDRVEQSLGQKLP